MRARITTGRNHPDPIHLHLDMMIFWTMGDSKMFRRVSNPSLLLELVFEPGHVDVNVHTADHHLPL